MKLIITIMLLLALPLVAADLPDKFAFDVQLKALNLDLDIANYNMKTYEPKGDKSPFSLAIKATGQLAYLYHPDLIGSQWSAVEYKSDEPLALYFDLNANGKLDANETIKPTNTDYGPMFYIPEFIWNTPTGKKISYRYILYSTGTSADDNTWINGSVMKGKTKINGKDSVITIWDADSDGMFDQFTKDCFAIEIGNRRYTQDSHSDPLANYVTIDDKCYRCTLTNKTVKSFTINFKKAVRPPTVLSLKKDSYRGEMALSGSAEYFGKMIKLTLIDANGDGDCTDKGQDVFAITYDDDEKTQQPPLVKGKLSDRIFLDSVICDLAIKQDKNTYLASITTYNGSFGSLKLAMLNQQQKPLKFDVVSVRLYGGGFDDSNPAVYQSKLDKIVPGTYSMKKSIVKYGQKDSSQCQVYVSAENINITADKQTKLTLAKPKVKLLVQCSASKEFDPTKQFDVGTAFSFITEVKTDDGLQYETFTAKMKDSRYHDTVNPVIKITAPDGKVVSEKKLEYG
ncbi:MAG: hypothetical protein JEZ07_13900 [Phycisphaerae bacterium]|nr:hypothetical protein [Phycisphaerae bacterium]